MSKADEHLQRAAECIRIARKSHDPKTKAVLLEMAQAWLKLAARAARDDPDGENRG